MATEKEKENSLNPEEPETSVSEEPLSEKTGTEEGEPQEKNPKDASSASLQKEGKPNVERLYARLKKAEEKVKELRQKLEEKEKSQPSEKGEERVDIFDLAKTVSALKDYSPEELGYIQMVAKAKGLTPEEAAKTEEAKLLIAAKREKVAKEQKVPAPSSPFGSSSSKTIEPGMSEEEIDKVLRSRFEKLQREGGEV